MEETKEFFEKNFKATAERDLIDTILFYLHGFKDDFTLLEMASMMNSICQKIIFKTLIEIEKENNEEEQVL